MTIPGDWNAQRIIALVGAADKFTDRIVATYDQYSDSELAVRLERAQPVEQITMLVYLDLRRKGGANFVPVLSQVERKYHLEKTGVKYIVAEAAGRLLTLNDPPRENPALLGQFPK